MKPAFWILLLAAVFGHVRSKAQPALALPLQDGDVVFQKLPCGGLCDAIIATTPCQHDRRYNHCGIVRRRDAQWWVIEAIGERVQETTLERFLSRDTAKALPVARPRYSGRKEALAAVERAAFYLGRPYDDPFLPGDSALYCSELVWEACRSRGKRMFDTRPMTFQVQGQTHPAWVDYYRSIGQPVPEGLPGINPCAIANSDQVRFFTLPLPRH